jgi:hypothetical protein
MKLTCPDYTLVWQTRTGRSRQSPPAAGPTARREGCTIQGCKVVFEPKVSWMACMSCERLLHEYPTKVKELLFLERRVSKLFKVRDIAMNDVTPEILGSGIPVTQPEFRPTRALISSLSAPPHTLHTSLHLQRNSRHLSLSLRYVVLFRLRT